MREGQVEESGPDLRIFEEKFIEIAEAEKQKRVRRNLLLDLPILLHHRRQGGLGHAGDFAQNDWKMQPNEWTLPGAGGREIAVSNRVRTPLI